jgi:hypothetical protein
VSGPVPGRWYDRDGPRRLPNPPGGRPLDPDRPTPDDTRPGTEPGAASGPATGGRRREPPRSLKSQLGATKDALVALVRSHVDLAKAEAAEIGGEIKIVLAAVGIALGALILIAFLLPIGLLLFFGEWLFGSMGWGVLLGTELLVLAGTAAVLSSLGAGRVPRSIAVAFLVGTIVAILFGTNAPNLLYSAIADQFGAGSDPGVTAFVVGAAIGAVILGLIGGAIGARNGTVGGAVGGLVAGAILGAILGSVSGGIARLAENEASRPLVVGLLLVGAIGGLVGLVGGARSNGLLGAASGFVVGFVLGGALGAFTAITFTWHVAIAIGIALFLGLAIGLMGMDVATRGIDAEALKARFYPQQTIDTTKETIEWAKARIPGAPRS